MEHVPNSESTLRMGFFVNFFLSSIDSSVKQALKLFLIKNNTEIYCENMTRKNNCRLLKIMNIKTIYVFVKETSNNNQITDTVISAV